MGGLFSKPNNNNIQTDTECKSVVGNNDEITAESSSLSENNPDKIYKIVLIGGTNSGKTRLLNKYVGNSLTGVEFKCKNLEDGTKLQIWDPSVIKAAKFRCANLNNGAILKIWDTAGQERFRTITKAYLGNAGAIVFTCAKGDKSTGGNNLRSWIETVQRDSENSVKCIALTSGAEVNQGQEMTQEDIKEVEEIAKEYAIDYIEVDLTNQQSVDTCFDNIVNGLNSQLSEEHTSHSSLRM